jgi:hypothetical protein
VKIPDNLESLLTEVSNLPTIVYPDEIDKEFPLVYIEKIKGVTSFNTVMKSHPYGVQTPTSKVKYYVYY